MRFALYSARHTGASWQWELYLRRRVTDFVLSHPPKQASSPHVRATVGFVHMASAIGENAHVGILGAFHLFTTHVSPSTRM